MTETFVTTEINEKINSSKIKFLLFVFVFFSLVNLTKVHKIKVVVKWLAKLMIVAKQQT